MINVDRVVALDIKPVAPLPAMPVLHPIAMQMHNFEAKRPAFLPLMAALITLPDRLVLIDTGFAKSDALLTELHALRIHPEDVNLIINTHVHPDHVGNNLAFPKAQIIISRVDYEFALTYSHAMLQSTNPVATFQSFYPAFSSRRVARYAYFSLKLVQNYWRDDVIGAHRAVRWIEEQPPLPPGFKLLATPGHTPGHYSVQIDGESRSVLVAGDAMPSRMFFKRNLREITPRYDERLFLESKTRIEQFDGILLGGHDLPFDTKIQRYIHDHQIALTESTKN